MANQKVILAQAGDLVFSCDFASLEEVVGNDRTVDRGSLPDGLVAGHPARRWVSFRSSWFPVRDLLPEERSERPTDQVLLVKSGETRGALRVSHVLGFEQLPPLLPVSPVVRRGTSFPLAGFRMVRGRIVLELDLSRLIE
jgi:hypothetical protein